MDRSNDLPRLGDGGDRAKCDWLTCPRAVPCRRDTTRSLTIHHLRSAGFALAREHVLGQGSNRAPLPLSASPRTDADSGLHVLCSGAAKVESTAAYEMTSVYRLMRCRLSHLQLTNALRACSAVHPVSNSAGHILLCSFTPRGAPVLSDIIRLTRTRPLGYAGKLSTQMLSISERSRLARDHAQGFGQGSATPES